MSKYTVFNYDGKIIGDANNFLEAKNIHKENLPKDLLEFYAGLDTQQLSYGHFAMPCFYVDMMSDDLKLKYGIGV